MKLAKWFLGFFLLLLVFSGGYFYLNWPDDEFKKRDCNIAVIPINGDIVSYELQDSKKRDFTTPDDVRVALSKAELDSEILGAVVTINSSGGEMVPAEIISSIFKRSTIPVIAYIQEVGTSAAYLIATGAKTIIASQFSTVGSIGVTMSYLEKSLKNTKEGIKYIKLTSGKYKDYGNFNKPLTAKERQLFERDLDIYHKHFVSLIAQNRDQPVSEISKLADGSAMPGTLALENKLVDFLGEWEMVRELFATAFGKKKSEIKFCY